MGTIFQTALFDCKKLHAKISMEACENNRKIAQGRGRRRGGSTQDYSARLRDPSSPCFACEDWMHAVPMLVGVPVLVNENVVHEAYTAAVKKHPHFAHSVEQAVVIMGEEFGEVARAVYEGDVPQAKKEAAQLAAVCLRFLEMETI